MITDDDIRRVVPERSFAAGLRYHLDGRVQELSVEADGTTIKSLVLRSGIDRSRPGDAVRLALMAAMRQLKTFSCLPPVLRSGHLPGVQSGQLRHDEFQLTPAYCQTRRTLTIQLGSSISLG